jgi:Zn-dependent protease
MGDPTARQAGRITLNPIRHIDPFMTILLPALLIISGSPIVFGGAKPVPINPHYFRNPRKGMVWVAIAGPLTNMVLAIISYLLFVALYNVTANTDAIDVSFSTLINIVPLILINILTYSIIINVILAVFNLLPIPPLDGGRIAVGLLPDQLARPLARLEPYGLIIVVILLVSGILQGLLGPVLRLLLSSLAFPA